jgi:hypothetical protein
MEEDDLVRLGRAYRRARAHAEKLHAELKAAVVDAYRRGERTMDIARKVGLDRELVRRIRKAAEDADELPKLASR